MPGRSENDPLTDSSVTVLRRCVINPTEKENYDDIFLGPLDLAFTAVPTNVITVYLNKDTSTVRGIIDANMFKAAYARALDYYPVLSGRLDENPNTGRRWIRSVGVAGAEFIEATCAKRLDQMAAANKSGRVFVSQLPGGSNALLCDFVPFDKEFVYKNALMSVQLTTFACGGVTLGYHVMHAVCDGTGTFNFIRDVAELYRKLCRALDSANPDSLSPEYLSDFCKQIYLNDPPQIDTSFLADWDLSASDEEKEKFRRLPTPPSLLSPNGVAEFYEPTVKKVEGDPIVGKELTISSSAFETLKKRCAEVGSVPDGSATRPFVSSYEALGAFLAISVFQARRRLHEKDPDRYKLYEPEGFYYTPVDQRQRGIPRLSDRYFYNAVISTTENMNEVDLAEGNYKAVASVIHQMTRRDTVQDPETVLNGLKWVAAQPDYTKLPFCYKETGIQVSSWCRFKTMSGQEYMNRNNSKELLLPHSCGPVFSPVSFCNGLFLVVNGDLSDPKSQVVHSTLPASLWEELETDEFFKSLVSV